MRRAVIRGWLVLIVLTITTGATLGFAPIPHPHPSSTTLLAQASVFNPVDRLAADVQDQVAAKATREAQVAAEAVRAARSAPVPRPPAPIKSAPQNVIHAPQAGSGSVNGFPCGGDLPPCRVLWNESKGNPKAINRTGCSGRGCYGLWQFDPLTWDHYGGVDYASDASPEIQNDKARLEWDHGRGCRHWSAC